ncbi:T9SS type A sorting domain-containing protein [Flavobacterium psychrotolerans]|uniref:Secretion protein n=1 Tax=Flavobacterium psychrotolerans TaxID=2169410 RepID=A0A2U1JIN0_9FLAO|nr:T9SS type A sorting domain-containing protein [Flavobacterium psychrotolerans]PWA04723.1 secretion protein [Flavobacterium psychrotolerans]
MKKTLLLFTILFQLNGFSQAPDIQWQKSLGGTSFDLAKSIQQTTDGGYIVAGICEYTDSGGHSFGNYYRIVKLSNTRTIEWEKYIGNSANRFSPFNIQQTTDGGYILASHSCPTNYTIDSFNFDYWILKLSSTGQVEWEKSLGGTNLDIANSIQQTTDGGYIVAGESASHDGGVIVGYGWVDCWIVKLSSTGTIQWQKKIGGSGYDRACSIQLTTDGGYIVAGETKFADGYLSGYHGDSDYYIVKLSSTGTIQWQKSLGGAGYDVASSIQQTTDGGYIVAGETQSVDGDVTGNHGGSDYWIVKLNGIGTIQWQKSIGGAGYDEASSIQQTTDGGYIVAGETQSVDGDVSGNHGGADYWIVKLNGIGTIQWQKSVGGSGYDAASSIQQTADGGYIIAGATGFNDGDVTTGIHGSSDYWIVKLAADPLATTTFNQKGFTIAPNPVKSVLNFQFPNETAIDRVIINDLTGKTVLQQTQNANYINVQSLAKGIYILQAFSGNETYQSKFVKE